MLGGQVIVELDGQGTKRKGIVWSGSTRIAEQWINAGDQSLSVEWRHETATTSYVKTYENGYYVREERDPLGAETGEYDPYLNTTDPSYGDMLGAGGGMFLESGDPFNLSSGCSLNGFAVSCDEANEMLASGAAQYDTLTTIYATFNGRTQTSSGYTSLTPGTNFHFTGAAAQAANFGFRVGNILGGFSAGVGGAIYAGMTAHGNSVEGSGMAGGFASFFAPPQRGTPLHPDRRLVSPSVYRMTSSEIQTLRQDLAAAVSNPDCANFIRSVLEQLNVGTTDIFELFNRVEQGGGFNFATNMPDWVQATGANYPTPTMQIAPTGSFSNLANNSPAHSLRRANTIIHELLHTAGKLHNYMAQAAYNVGGRHVGWKYWEGDFPVRGFFPEGEQGDRMFDGALSGFWNNVLMQNCPLPR